MKHLTNEQFADVTLGLSTPEMNAHLAACEHCSAEVRNVNEAIGMFREVAVEWTERHAATMTPIERPSLWVRMRYSFRPAVGMVAATALAVMVVVPVARDHFMADSAPAPSAQVTHSAPVQAEQQIANDDQLMMNIDQAIATPENAFAVESSSRSN